jgi:phosphoribosylformimino-5-aminoimidazole carboxamide ribotide isomerase
MKGSVVQGLRGQRQHYRAVCSDLVDGCEPLQIARALSLLCGGPAVYVADLDAIAGTGDHRDVIRELHDRLGAECWVDAGVSDLTGGSCLLAAGASRVVVGTETLPGLDALRALSASQRAASVLVSIDVGEHGVLSECEVLKGRPPLEVLERLAAEGVDEVILLDLPHVGTGAGPDLKTLRAARTAFPSLRLICGGGVRTPDDLRALAEAGADGVLLATALHRRWVTAADIDAMRSEGETVTTAP